MIAQPDYNPKPNADSLKFRAQILKILRPDHPQTLRQLYYRLVMAGNIPKTPQAYIRLTNRLKFDRRSGAISYDWISDSTRWRREPTVFTGLEDLLDSVAVTYRLSLWQDQQDYVEIWCEKDAVAGVLEPITDSYGVSLMSARGFSSITFLKESGDRLKYLTCPIYVYYFGDHDPSGHIVAEVIERELAHHSKNPNINFTFAAITQRQRDRLHCLTRPTKNSKHSKNWTGGASADIEALPVGYLKRKLESCIRKHIHQGVWQKSLQKEIREKARLARWFNDFQAGNMPK